MTSAMPSSPHNRWKTNAGPMLRSLCTFSAPSRCKSMTFKRLPKRNSDCARASTFPDSAS
jgi:hypothetical protein